MSDSLKQSFQQTMGMLHAAQMRGYDELSGKSLPCHVVEISGSIVTVQFDMLPGRISFPQITIPVFGSEYVRLPIQKGDKGVTVPASVSLRGVSGLGTGLADMNAPPSLTALFFMPMANIDWFAVDPNILTMYGIHGATMMTTDDASSVKVTETQVKAESANVRLKGNLWFDGPITQENTGPGTSISLIGPVTVTFDVTAGNISLENHTHPIIGVQSGSSTINTGKAQ